MTPLAVSRMMLLAPLCLPSIPAASPAHPPAPPRRRALLRRGCSTRDQQVVVTVVTCCHKSWAWEGGAGAVGRAGVPRGAPAAGAARWRGAAGSVPALRGAIPGRAAMGTKPRYGEINSWTFWPGFCRTNLAGTRGN